MGRDLVQELHRTQDALGECRALVAALGGLADFEVVDRMRADPALTVEGAMRGLIEERRGGALGA